ncbi:hypothetical protein O9G_005412 [Rozella allomycis CSF55]|uniref:CCHC-type domain-containing protein n=1 Tax=Rozella allomycis (strain CSF55) TaxID=988480 RepID=A0A075AXZ1_ROZAC|nr:hypothetical protein O9G_005412 [Rozella allomycis CSF55]|eukprot:EPZ35102.1 hypothetical protein O9G_005412 [Rozella allomycis CSF55]
MEIDTAKMRTLSNEERQRRKDLNLCFYCGKDGHKIFNCNIKNQHCLLQLRNDWSSFSWFSPYLDD